jgi:hypothetical protein
MLMGDLNVIDVQWIIQYRIEDPIRFLFKVRSRRKTIRDTTEAIMRRAVCNRLGSDVLSTGRVAVASEAKTEIQKILSAYETSVRLVTVELQDVTPPDTVKPAFNEVNESRQDKERTINRAQEQANREIPKAREVTTQRISEADKLGLDEFVDEVMPEDKAGAVKRFQERGSIVAMAGDGINDGPALAQAQVGIAMGTGTDVAVESTRVTLVKGDLRGIVRAALLSKATMRNIKQNLFFAFIYNTLGVPIASGVLYPVFGLLLSPMIAAAAKSFSSVSVVGNALRLKRVDI